MPRKQLTQEVPKHTLSTLTGDLTLKQVILILAVTFVLFLGISNRDNIALQMFQTGIENQFKAKFLSPVTDGLHIGLCGAGSAIPAPQASGPCISILAGDQLYIVDAGSNSARNLTFMGLKPGDISAVFLTHFHSDHIDGLGELATLRWFQGAHSKPLQVYGPEGINQVVDGLNMAYEINNQQRITNFNREPENPTGAGMEAIIITASPDVGLSPIFKTEDFEILAFNVSHMPAEQSLGYKVIYKDRSAVISGDTLASEAVTKASMGVDLLVHNALAPRLVAVIRDTATELGLVFLAGLMTDLTKLHASPMQAAQVAQSAGVKHLLYYHVIPPLIAPGQGRLFLDGAQNVFPDYTIGRDGVIITLPANSDQVIVVPSTL